MAERDALQAQFQELTGADATTAQFYLESAGWKLDTATATFFDNAAGNSSPMAAAPPPAKPAPPVVASEPAHAPPAHKPSGAPSRPPGVHSRPPNARAGGIRTLGEIRSPDSDEEEQEGKDQSWYAGGAASGQVVKPARKPAASGADVVKEVFESAKSHGAEEIDPREAHGHGKDEKKAFEGTGFRLGTSMAPSMPDPSTVKKAAAQQQQNRVIAITFWRQGFSVDDGPLRKFDDPANKPFLDDIHSGHIPRELHGLAHGAQLNVNLVDKSHEDYAPPKVVVKPFAGSGQKLGNTPSAAVDPTPHAAAASAPPPAAPSIDASQPSTSLQIRLADGTRLVAKFNVTATIGNVRAFIDAARVGSKAYTLQTPMPIVVLSDNSKTLKELGLLNATIIQKM